MSFSTVVSTPPLSHYITNMRVAERKVDNLLEDLKYRDIPHQEYFEIHMQNLKADLRKTAEDMEGYKHLMEDIVELSPEYLQFRNRCLNMNRST